MRIDSCEDHNKFNVHCKKCIKVSRFLSMPKEMSLKTFERIQSIEIEIERCIIEKDELKSMLIIKQHEILTLQKHHHELLHIQVRMPKNEQA